MSLVADKNLSIWTNGLRKIRKKSDYLDSKSIETVQNLRSKSGVSALEDLFAAFSEKAQSCQ
jgi:hypothetical protein